MMGVGSHCAQTETVVKAEGESEAVERGVGAKRRLVRKPARAVHAHSSSSSRSQAIAGH